MAYQPSPIPKIIAKNLYHVHKAIPVYILERLIRCQYGQFSIKWLYGHFKLPNNQIVFLLFLLQCKKEGIQPINVPPLHVKSTFFLPTYRTIWERYSRYKIRVNSNMSLIGSNSNQILEYQINKRSWCKQKNVKCVCSYNATNSLSRQMRRHRTCVDMSLFSIAIVLHLVTPVNYLLLLNSTSSLLLLVRLVISCR